MASFRMNPDDLTESEIDYELKIRGENLQSSLPIKKQSLRALLRNEIHPPSEGTNQNPLLYLHSCTSHLHSLQQDLLNGPSNDQFSNSKIASRLIHLRDRLGRIQPHDNHTQERVKNLKKDVMQTLTDINDQKRPTNPRKEQDDERLSLSLSDEEPNDTVRPSLAKNLNPDDIFNIFQPKDTPILSTSYSNPNSRGAIPKQRGQATVNNRVEEVSQPTVPSKKSSYFINNAGKVLPSGFSAPIENPSQSDSSLTQPKKSFEEETLKDLMGNCEFLLNKIQKEKDQLLEFRSTLSLAPNNQNHNFPIATTHLQPQYSNASAENNRSLSFNRSLGPNPNFESSFARNLAGEATGLAPTATNSRRDTSDPNPTGGQKERLFVECCGKFQKLNQELESLVQNFAFMNSQGKQQPQQTDKVKVASNHSFHPSNPHFPHEQARLDRLSLDQYQQGSTNDANLLDNRNNGLPINKWGFKFSGDGTGMHLLDFLQTVEIYMNLEQKTKQEVLNSAFHLFSGRAKTWYMTWRHTFGTYDYLIDRLKANFLSADHDLVLRHEIEQREQRPNEIFIQFLTDVEYKCQQLTKPLSEQEKLFIIRRNLNSFYSSRLGAHDIYSIEHLVKLCDRVDTYSRSVRTNTATNPNSSANRNQSVVPSTHRNPNRTFRVNEVASSQENDTETLSSNEEEEINVVRTVTRLPLKSSTGPQIDSKSVGQNKNLGNPQASGYTFRNQHQSQEPQNSKTQPKPIQCFNCKKFGHGFKDCRTPQTRIFCYRCGQEDTYSFECLCGSGNGQ
jgi:hypothetical protein